MEFEWDDAEAASNLRKHGVSFEEAVTVFLGPIAITSLDEAHSQAEKRERTIGISSKLRVLVVVHTRRTENTVRIIGARKATRPEVDDYEEEIRQQYDLRPE